MNYFQRLLAVRVFLVMSAYFCLHLMFSYGYLIEFVCLKIDLIRISYNLVYWA